MKRVLYFTYITLILLLTLYFSFLIIGEKAKPRYVLIAPNLPSKEKASQGSSEGCPCKKVGIESSKCRIMYHKKSDNPNLYLQLVPGAEQIADGSGVCLPAFHVKINSYGFRDYEYPIEKPPNTFRIVALGDSITFGEGVELNETYPKILEKMLNEKSKKVKYEVLNFGVGGYNAAEKVEVLATVAINFTPDLIIFQYLGDDIINWTEFRNIEYGKIKDYAEKLGKNVSELTPFELGNIHKIIYTEYLEVLEEKKFEDVWKIVEEAFERLTSITRGKINVLLLYETHEPQLSRLKRIAKINGWFTLDMNEILGKYPREKVVIPKVGRPNPFGFRLIAEEIYQTLLSNNLLGFSQN
jgi:hypothetical protein